MTEINTQLSTWYMLHNKNIHSLRKYVHDRQANKKTLQKNKQPVFISTV